MPIRPDPDPLTLPETAETGEPDWDALSKQVNRAHRESSPAYQRHRARLVALAALLFGLLLGFAVGRVDATPRSAPEHVPSTAFRSVIGAPSSVRALPVVADPLGAPTPAAAEQPSASAVSVREGLASWMPERYGPDYLALPIGPGHRVELCGPGGCITMVSTDSGPDLASQRAGRVADIGVLAWERLSGVPRSFGLCPITWTLVP